MNYDYAADDYAFGAILAVLFWGCFIAAEVVFIVKVLEFISETP